MGIVIGYTHEAGGDVQYIHAHVSMQQYSMQAL